MVDTPVKEPINEVELWSQNDCWGLSSSSWKSCHCKLIWQRYGCLLGKYLTKSSSVILN